MTNALRPSHWSVNVSVNGESLVTIESNCLSGKPEFTDQEAQIIRDAAAHLTAFIGEPKPKAPEHDWQFYANGSFCRKCGAQIGSGSPCR